MADGGRTGTRRRTKTLLQVEKQMERLDKERWRRYRIYSDMVRNGVEKNSPEFKLAQSQSWNAWKRYTRAQDASWAYKSEFLRSARGKGINVNAEGAASKLAKIRLTREQYAGY